MTKSYERPLTPDELKARPDGDIDTSDIPLLDETFWNGATLRQPSAKSVVSLRLPQNVIDHFKSRFPKGYTSSMSAVLAAYVEHAERDAQSSRTHS